ncbi:MAG: hypothetical protein ACYS7Y_34660, partial [Planctomycetota bacterium]
ENTMKNREYYDTCMCNFVDVSDFEKPVMIVSEGKSTLAYETVVMMADRENMLVELAMLRCEDGELHEHAFVSHREHADGTKSYARKALEMVFDAKAGAITRPVLQFKLGKMLGYTDEDILGFIASRTARHCPCDCCGGPFVDEKFFDVPTDFDMNATTDTRVDLIDGEGYRS